MIGVTAATGSAFDYFLGNNETDNDGNSSFQKDVTFSSEFESGSIGSVRKMSGEIPTYELELRNDNNDPSLPDSFRTWWYVRANDVPTGQPLRLEFIRLGFPYRFVPVYSYDNKNWRHFSENEVQMSSDCSGTTLPSCRLAITKQFSRSPVWIARTFPYTTKDLDQFLGTISRHPSVKIETLGYSPAKKWPMKKVTITDEGALPPQGNKKSIFINARTHPGETAASLVLEGIIRTILSDTEVGRNLRRDYVFHIVPMVNADGVIMGNYRTNAKSKNLENSWRFDRQAAPPIPLKPDAPTENQMIGRLLYQLQQDKNRPLVLALNLHSSNSGPDDPPFFYPHFGSNPNKYTEAQRRLWSNQIAFINWVQDNYGGPIAAPPVEGGRGFLNSDFQESWIWYNKQDQTNAITFESVYSKAGLGHWTTPEDNRRLGVAIARTIEGDQTQLPVPRVRRELAARVMGRL